jgi:hypothetical protein
MAIRLTSFPTKAIKETKVTRVTKETDRISRNAQARAQKRAQKRARWASPTSLS